MKDRQPIELKAAMQVYNVYETLLSALMLYMFVTELIGKNVFTMRVDNSRSGARLAMAIWLSYQSKFIEYADTFFMVTRKKFDQVTFLHVLHHSEMAPLMLLWVHYAPGGTSAFGPMLNAGIHTLMCELPHQQCGAMNLPAMHQSRRATTLFPMCTNVYIIHDVCR